MKDYLATDVDPFRYSLPNMTTVEVLQYQQQLLPNLHFYYFNIREYFGTVCYRVIPEQGLKPTEINKPNLFSRFIRQFSSPTPVVTHYDPPTRDGVYALRQILRTPLIKEPMVYDRYFVLHGGAAYFIEPNMIAPAFELSERMLRESMQFHFARVYNAAHAIF